MPTHDPRRGQRWSSRRNFYDDDEFNHTLDARRYRREASYAKGDGYESNDNDNNDDERDPGLRYERVFGIESGNGRREEDRQYARDIEARRQREWELMEEDIAQKHASHGSSTSASHLLAADILASLGATEEEERVDDDHDHDPPSAEETLLDPRRRRKTPFLNNDPGLWGGVPGQSFREETKARVVSGAHLEEGNADTVRRRGGGAPPIRPEKKEGSWAGSSRTSLVKVPLWKQKRFWITLVILIIVMAVVIPVVVVEMKKANEHPQSSSSSEADDDPLNSNLEGLSHDSIPAYARGTVLDPWTWYDTTDFNVTFTNETVGGLPIMGLNSTWDDSTRANEHVPPLNESFPYGSQPIRGVNLGGWLSIEPFIVPSLFSSYSSSDKIVDEWTLSKKLGTTASSTIEKHYAKFINESDFADIQNAGLDHVRIQYSYWAITTYDDDPYVAKTAWRYLLRAIEYCRKYGLRVKLDLHGLPGSQNGWNHSGREGNIDWIQGSDGALNRKRSLEIHDQVSKFFAQPRYKNVVTIYGLVNEPLMLSLPVEQVLNWTTQATQMIQKNGITAYIAVHDGFLNLSKWKSMLKTRPDRMFLDTHQYTIFNTGQIVLNHTTRVNLICNDWYHMIQQINTTSEGWGPTICGEWSQADTDCAQYLNNVGHGTRWEGTLDTSSSTQYCPTASSGTCSCSSANADPSLYSDGYKTFLQTYAEAQMSAFETAQGWFYWTWQTESAAQWSYKKAWKGGFMPEKAYAPRFKCGDAVPDFGDLPEFY